MSRLQRLSACGSARLACEGMEGLDPDLASYERFCERLRKGLQVYTTEEETLELAAGLAEFVPSLTLQDKKALTLLAVCCLVAVRQGSTYLPFAGERSSLAETASALLNAGGPDDSEGTVELLRTISAMVGEGRPAALVGAADEYKPLIVDGGGLYLERMLRLELGFCERLRTLSRRSSGVFAHGSIVKLLDSLDCKPIALTDEQKHAVTTALTHPISIISGGPGTGKTSIVIAMLCVLTRLGVSIQDIILTAPTGKAANRLTESVGSLLDADASVIPEAMTIHRLLRYSPSRDRFMRDENSRLSGRIVIVDEASMIDLYLMERLMSSLPEDALLVLLGDADQLPSVEAGAVLGELMHFEHEQPQGLALGIVRLTKSFRMREDDPEGRRIYLLADAIRRGASGELRSTGNPLLIERPSAGDCRLSGAEFVDTEKPEDVLALFCDRWYAAKVLGLRDFRRLVSKRYHYGREGFYGQDLQDLNRLFAHFESFRILCATNVYATGTDAVNRLFHAKALDREGFDRPVEFGPGEPVLMERNDYTRNLFNGDQGIVLRVSPRKGVLRLMAVFRRGDAYVAFPADALHGNLSLAYAVSVHRSQGSEYQSIALILPEQDVKILTQEIFYTAITRAKTGAVLVGRWNILEKGIQSRVKRACGIGRRLREES